jgi:hypothetical protein
MSNAELILSRLDKVKQTGDGRWTACCPAHEDKSPSLAVRELDGGRVLLHCFAGCETPDVLAALGLDMNDLFLEGAKAHHAKPERRPFPAADVLRCVANEALIVAAGAVNLPAGHPDRERLITAAARQQAAANAAGVS